MNRRRFPGINPFQLEEQDRFFGRDDDIHDLNEKIILEKTVVLFGKSGHGKSSLINAGIVPCFISEYAEPARRYKPFVIKFGAYLSGRPSPVETARQFIARNLEFAGHTDLFEADLLPSDSGNSLWHDLKRSGENQFLLIFDQFEEFFTYPLAMQEHFADEISKLLYGDLPVELAGKYSSLPEKTQNFLAVKLDIKALFAIREDRLHLLDKLDYLIPAIFSCRYALRPLSKKQAWEALEKPAQLNGEFITPPFDFTPDALEQIFSFLTDQMGWVETNQLQILAESFEKRALAEKITVFTLENLGALNTIIKNYYLDKINALPADADRLAVRKLCEEGLAMEGAPPLRLILHEVQIQRYYGISPALLDKLIVMRLLRAEAGVGGGYTYELPHDTLLDTVLELKRERLNQEALDLEVLEKKRLLLEAEEAKQREQDANRRAEEARQLKNEAVLGRRRAKAFAITAAIVAMVAIVFGFFAWQQRILAIKNKQEVAQKADETRTALEKMRAAEAARLKIEVSKYLTSAKRMIEIGDSVMSRKILREAQMLDSTNIEIKKLLQNF